VLCTAVIPFRDFRSLDRRPIYHITFATPTAASIFTSKMLSFSDPKVPGRPVVRFPPGSNPEFRHADRRSKSIKEQEVILQNVLTAGGGAPGRCVLLTICGLGGRTRSTGLLPRTEEVRAILEEKQIELCSGDAESGSAGVQRVVLENRGNNVSTRVLKADGRGLGAEGRWLIRCRSESEAHRVVRELHMRPPWDGGGKFRAEVIY